MELDSVLLQLPREALHRVVLFLPNPEAAIQSCKAVRDITNTFHFRLEWVELWFQQRTLNRHPVYAAMTFKLLKEADLGAFSLALMQRQHDAGRRLHGADSGLLAKARCHLEQSVASGEGSSGAACPAMLAALRCISPHEGHLLFSYAALGGRAGVVRALFMLSNVPHYTFFFRPCGAGEFLRYHQVPLARNAAARSGYVNVTADIVRLGDNVDANAPEFLPKELGPEASLELAALGGSAACIKVLLAAPDLYNGPATNYVLVAAAQGGSCEAVALIAEGLQPLRFKQILPSALAAAGAAGQKAVLQQLLDHPLISSRPLAIAAQHAGAHGWPAQTLHQLLRVVMWRHRQQLDDVTVLLLPAMRAAMASRQDGVADALWAAMQEGTPEPELFVDLLTLFAARGQLERVRWVLKAAPTVMVKAGAEPALAALEAGHEAVADLLLEVSSTERKRAAAARGRVAAAVRAGDVAAAKRLLGTVHLSHQQGNLEMLDAAIAAGHTAMLALLLQAVPTREWQEGEWLRLAAAVVGAGRGVGMLSQLHATAAVTASGRRAFHRSPGLLPALWGAGGREQRETALQAAQWALALPQQSARALSHGLDSLGSSLLETEEYLGMSPAERSPANMRALDPHLSLVAELLQRLAATPVEPPPGATPSPAAAPVAARTRRGAARQQAAPPPVVLIPPGGRTLTEGACLAVMDAGYPDLFAALLAYMDRWDLQLEDFGAR